MSFIPLYKTVFLQIYFATASLLIPYVYKDFTNSLILEFPPEQSGHFKLIYIYISQRPFVSHVFTSSLVFFVLLLSLLRRASSSSSSLVFFDDPQSSSMLLSLLRRSSSSSSSSFSFFSFFSEVQRDMLSFRRLIVEWAPLSCKLPFIVPGRAWPPSIDQSQVTPFILLKSICAEGLTRRHETECRHATRRHATPHWSRMPEPPACSFS